MEARLDKSNQQNLYSKKSYKKRSSIKNIRKQTRNSKRRVRRKRNKVKYYKTLKKIRRHKSSEDLCTAVQVFDISDMDWTPAKCSSNLPTEVLEWHKQDQIAYWKSRAISFELENRMLKQHLRNVYAQTIIDCSNINEECIEEGNTESSTSNKSKKNEKVNEKEVIPHIPEPEVKNRLKEMRKIYGDKAEKLMGMETAIQLNYERHLEKSKPIFWPSIPLKLSFE